MKPTIIITGAGGNLGKATVKKFLEMDFHVIALLSPNGKIPLQETNADVEWLPMDATDEASMQILIDSLIQKYKTIHAALMLIGGFAAGTIENTGKKELEEMLMLNFYTAYFTARPVFKHMLKQKHGKLVFVASAPAIHDDQGYEILAYTLAKSLLIKLVKILNSKSKATQVQCSVIAPTIIDSRENRTAMPDADFSKWTSPEQIAELLSFYVKNEGFNEVVTEI